MTSIKSFSELLELHRRLDGLFLEHQRALLRLNLERASGLLDQYERELLAHIRDEEILMMPLTGSATAPVGGAAEIFWRARKLRHSWRSSDGIEKVATG